MSKKIKGAERLAGDTYYFPDITNSGYKGGCLIDTGPDDRMYSGLPIKEILITHGHADHFSCAASLRRCGVLIIAAREEVPLVENPEINIRGMFSWAKPSDEMITKLFHGEGCPVDAFLDMWHDSGIQIIPLPGHTLGHTGFLTEDGILFTGDALYVKDIWRHHPLPYAIDIGLTKSSLQLIESLDFKCLVPSHGEPIPKEESTNHINYHIERLAMIDTLIIDSLREARTTEEIISLVSASLDLIENPPQYWLAVTTIKGFLANLLQRQLIEFFVSNHAGYWRTIDYQL